MRTIKVHVYNEYKCLDCEHLNFHVIQKYQIYVMCKYKNKLIQLKETTQCINFEPKYE